jgi:hypothetical protein
VHGEDHAPKQLFDHDLVRTWFGEGACARGGQCPKWNTAVRKRPPPAAGYPLRSLKFNTRPRNAILLGANDLERDVLSGMVSDPIVRMAEVLRPWS